jgi:hypothetical protein
VVTVLVRALRNVDSNERSAYGVRLGTERILGIREAVLSLVFTQIEWFEAVDAARKIYKHEQGHDLLISTGRWNTLIHGAK